jgi:hypothetical protein
MEKSKKILIIKNKTSAAATPDFMRWFYQKNE